MRLMKEWSQGIFDVGLTLLGYAIPLILVYGGFALWGYLAARFL